MIVTLFLFIYLYSADNKSFMLKGNNSLNICFKSVTFVTFWGLYVWLWCWCVLLDGVTF